MKVIIQWFKGLFLIGLILIFLSFFLEWYSFKTYFGNEITVSWGYNLFYGWRSPLFSVFNETERPIDFSIPFFINFILIGIIIISGYVVFFMSIEKASSLEKYKIYAYINGTLLLLVSCYILLFPIMYLLQNGLYFPLFYMINPDSGLTTIYSVGLGYILQLFSFPLLFPYSLFYIRTIMVYDQEEDTVEKRVSKIVDRYQEPLELDRFIAEEEAIVSSYNKL